MIFDIYPNFCIWSSLYLKNSFVSTELLLFIPLISRTLTFFSLHLRIKSLTLRLQAKYASSHFAYSPSPVLTCAIAARAEEEFDRAKTKSESSYYQQYSIILAEPLRNKVCIMCFSPTTMSYTRCKAVHYWYTLEFNFFYMQLGDLCLFVGWTWQKGPQRWWLSIEGDGGGGPGGVWWND